MQRTLSKLTKNGDEVRQLGILRRRNTKLWFVYVYRALHTYKYTGS